MVRPQKERLVKVNPRISYFKPRGIPMVDLEEVRLTVDELEALRLGDLMGMSHEDAGTQMGVSRATFGRIIQRARTTVSDALVNGKALLVEGGTYKMVDEGFDRRFRCTQCQREWTEPLGTGRPEACPACGASGFFRVGKGG